MYSVLAAMGLLDHGIKSPLGEPQHFTQKNVTKQDYKLSQWVWTKVLVSKASQKWSLPVPQSTAPTPSPHPHSYSPKISGWSRYTKSHQMILFLIRTLHLTYRRRTLEPACTQAGCRRTTQSCFTAHRWPRRIREEVTLFSSPQCHMPAVSTCTTPSYLFQKCTLPNN